MADSSISIRILTPKLEKRILKNPLLNIDTFIIPSPYIKYPDIEKDYTHSYVWYNEGEILGYMVVYSNPENNVYFIYKLATSPFGRGKGIGSSFIRHLAERIPSRARISLYIWEKQADTVEFFHNRGFITEEQIVYRNLIYYYLSVSKEDVKNKLTASQQASGTKQEEIGKTRHDARKNLLLLSNMVEMLTIDNCDRMIEDINRETTSLINMLNSYRDSMEVVHEVNLRELILARLVPFVKTAPVPCRLLVNLDSESPVVLGYHVNISRALLNLLSNSIDAIEESGRKGNIRISLHEVEDNIVMVLQDNGIGIKEDLLEIGETGFPKFVGNTTKGKDGGEGVGTRQIYSTFGTENITVNSVYGKGTTWEIIFAKYSSSGPVKQFLKLERQFNEFKTLWEDYSLSGSKTRNDIIAYIWQIRKMEIFLFDIIMQFSKYHNIRTIYRTILAFYNDRISADEYKDTVEHYKTDNEAAIAWLYEIVSEIKIRGKYFREKVDPEKFRGPLFKSYGQALENNIIFTLDPETGRFKASDRKLAEHLDFVTYLGKEKDSLLRGEFKGDVSHDSQPIFLGLWSVESEEDLRNKLLLLRRGANTLVGMGLHPDKKLSFYQTTYPRWKFDIDTYRSLTLNQFGSMSDEELFKCTKISDNEFSGYAFAVD
jgi:signal transduction histidine kinase